MYAVRSISIFFLIVLFISNTHAEEVTVSSEDFMSMQAAAESFKADKTVNSSYFSLPPSISSEKVELIPHDLRAENYEQRENMQTSISGDIEVSLFKSKHESKDNFLRVSMTTSGELTTIEGLVKKDGQFYAIRPTLADTKGHTYSIQEINPTELHQAAMACGITPEHHIGHSKSLPVAVTRSSEITGLSTKTIELATDADFDFVQRYGGSSSSANARILTILNGVDGIYQNEFNVTFSVTFQNAWTTSSDPYTTTDASSLLSEFRSYWQSNFSSTQTYDLAHLWTGVDLDGSTVGIAYLDVACSSFRYGLSQYYNVSGAEETLTAHEIGHNLNADHDSCSGGSSFVMCPFVIPFETTFSTTSKNVINTALDTYSCITSGGGGGSSPSPSPSSSPGASASPSPSASSSPVPPSQSPSPSSSPGPKYRYDLRGNDKASFSVYRAALGGWYDGTVSDLSNGSFGFEQLGLHYDTPLIGDYDGDGLADRTVYREGTWFTKKSSNGQITQASLGGAGIIPVAGRDFDGDRIDDFSVYDPSTAVFSYFSSKNSTLIQTSIGGIGYLPVACDYDGNGLDQVAVYHLATQTWIIVDVNGTPQTTAYGEEGDIPVPAKYTPGGACSKAIWRPTTGEWYIEGQSAFQWGLPGDLPVPADFDGNGVVDTAVWRPSFGILYVRNADTSTQAVQLGLYFDKIPQLEPRLYALRNAFPNFDVSKGTSGSHAVSYVPNLSQVSLSNETAVGSISKTLTSGNTLLEGDYDGDGSSDSAQFLNGIWEITLANGTSYTRQWGVSGDIPVSGDFDGDGITDLSVYRPNDSGIFSKWYTIHSSDNGVYEVAFGLSGDIPTPMDISGDGVDDIVVLRPGSMLWYARDGRSGGYLGSYQWGLSGDQPCHADYNGDGYDDLCVYRPGVNFYFIYFTKVGVGFYQWGLPGDVPLTTPGRTAKIGVYRPSNGTIYNRSIIDGSVTTVNYATSGTSSVFANATGVAVP